jgi:hypothetical protein
VIIESNVRSIERVIETNTDLIELITQGQTQETYERIWNIINKPEGVPFPSKVNTSINLIRKRQYIDPSIKGMVDITLYFQGKKFYFKRKHPYAVAINNPELSDSKEYLTKLMTSLRKSAEFVLKKKIKKIEFEKTMLVDLTPSQ